MARPIKKGLDYFPMQTNILSDLKVRRMKRKYGAESFLLYVTFLCDIYSNGFYLKADEEYLYDISEQMQMPENRVTELLNAMLDLGLFNLRLFEEKQVLTSEAVQKYYFSFKSKLLGKLDKEEADYLLGELKEAETSVLEMKTPKMEVETPKIEALSTQKEKEKRIENKRESESACMSDREQWQIWKTELLADEDWRASAVRQSGQGIGFVTQLSDKLDEFCDFIVSCGEQESVKARKDFVRRFHYWLAYYGTKEKKTAGARDRPKSKVAEMKRVSDASLEIAKRILAGQCG